MRMGTKVTALVPAVSWKISTMLTWSSTCRFTGLFIFSHTVRCITSAGAYLRPLPTKQEEYVESANQLKLHYLEVPLNMVLKFPLTVGKFVVGGGPYFAYGLGGTYDLDLMYNGRVVSTDSSRHPVQLQGPGYCTGCATEPVWRRCQHYGKHGV